jgi:hypothetical protein
MIKLHFVVPGLLVMLTLCQPVYALIYVEDFEHDFNPGEGGFASSIFDHKIEPMLEVRNPYYSFSLISGNQTDFSLFLSFMVDEITFSLEPGQYIESASIRLNGMNGLATFTAIGTEDIFTVSTSEHRWITVDTLNSPTDIGAITGITLEGSLNGHFDDLEIHVVPEPATVLLFGLGALALRRRRKT